LRKEVFPANQLHSALVLPAELKSHRKLIFTYMAT